MRSVTTLLIFPLILIISGCISLLQISPLHAGLNNLDADPAYVYLFSALNVLEGYPIRHVDHPGTPLQILSAVVIYIQWAIARLNKSSENDIFSVVSLQPESYILTIGCVLLLLNAWATYYFGKQIFQSTDRLKLAVFSQSAPLGFWIVVPKIVYLAPEALLIFASLCLLGLLAPLILGTNELQRKMEGRVPMLAGVVCGFGIAVKLTFFPMLGLLLLLGTRKKVIQAFIILIITWGICIWPVRGYLKFMGEWIYALATHSGAYGSGEISIIPGDLVEKFESLFTIFPFFYFVSSALLGAIVFGVIGKFMHNKSSLGLVSQEKDGANIFYALPWGNQINMAPLLLFMVGVFQSFLFIKHPNDRYMVPVLPIAWVSAIWLLQFATNIIDLSTKAVARLHIMLLGLGCLMTWQSVVHSYDDMRNQRLVKSESLTLIQNELLKYKTPLVIGYTGCILPQCALSFGSLWAPYLEEKMAQNVLHNYIEYNKYSDQLIVHAKGRTEFPVNYINNYLEAGREVFFVTSINSIPKTLIVKPLITLPTQSLYRVIGVSNIKS